MNINGTTRLIGLIGNPVGHTLSPVIHNNISNMMNISSVYVPFKVENGDVSDAVKGAYALNVLGLNVTVPYKNQVMECLADIDDAARYIGAVNTLVRDEEKCGYKGYNTDMLGLRRQIIEDGIILKDRTVVVLGAGGAAKAVVYMCLLEGAGRIYILNRTEEKARDISDSMNKLVKQGHFHYQNNKNDTAECNMSGSANMADRVIPCSISQYESIPESNLIVFQATSIGLSPNVDDVVIDVPEFYDKVSIGVDIIYNPANTRFMQLVKEHGGKAYNSLKMLLYQGIIAYELWHNIEVSDDVVEDVYVELKRGVYHRNNIVLIGFMGSGKTTVGKKLADELSMNYIDTDEYIETREGMSIQEIFDKKGEDEFRRIETECLNELRSRISDAVISTGGGMPLRTDNARLLKEIGTVFYLTAANQVIYDRIKDDNKRPLLKSDNPYERICSLMKDRTPIYKKACDHDIDTNSNDICAVVKEIINYYKQGR